jgi:hypothetical protein
MTVKQRAPWRNPRHLEPSRIVGEPEEGFFKVQLMPRGPYYAARIAYRPSQDPLTGEELDRSWYWRVEIDGDLVGEASPDPVAAGVFTVWEHGLSITEQEYHKMLEQSKKDRNISFKPMVG